MPPVEALRDIARAGASVARSGVLSDGSLRWIVREIGSVLHVSFAGVLDLASAREADANLRERLTVRSRLVVLDAGGIDFVDSVGLRVLIRTKRDLDEREGRLVISRPSASLTRLIQAAGLDTPFDSLPPDVLGSARCPVCEGSLDDDTVCQSCGSRL